MSKTFIFFAFFLLNYLSEAQQAFTSKYDPPSGSPLFGEAFDIIRARGDSGYFQLGTLLTAQDSGMVLMRVGNDGTLLWNRVYQILPASSTNFGFFVKVLSDSTLWVNGYQGGRTINLKLDQSGNLLLAKEITSFPGGRFHAEDEINGEIYSVGEFYTGGIHGGIFSKRDLDGNMLWSKQFSGSTSSKIVLTSFTPTIDGGFLLVGSRQIFNTTIPAAGVICKTDHVGNIQWQKQITVAGTAIYPKRVIQTSDNGFLFLMINGWGGKSLILKTDSLGNILWNGYVSKNVISNMAILNFSVLPNGNFLFPGFFSSTNPKEIGTVILNNSGNIVHAHKFVSDTMAAYAHYFDQSGLALFGYNQSLANFAFTLLKTDTAFLSACGDSPAQYTLTPASLSDSVLNLTTSIITPLISDVTSSIAVSSMSLTKIDYCPPIFSANEELKERQVVHFGPVPAKDAVTFTVEKIGEYQLTLFDITGRAILDRKYSGNSFKLERGIMNSGIYFFRMTNDEGITSGKIIFE